jgi:hypothetical protein
MGRFEPLRIESTDITMDGRPVWRLLRNFDVDLGTGSTKISITVPRGTETDFASVPWFIRWLYSPYTARYGKAAVVHDWLYTTKAQIPRFVADALFREIMRLEGSPWYERVVLYYCVRFFGWRHYQKA